LTTFIINFWDSKHFSLLHNGNTLPSFLLVIQCIIKSHMRTWRFWWKPLIKWQICGDLKVTALLLGPKQGFTKCRCFYCERNSRPRSLHYSRKDWLVRKFMEPRIMNVENQPLVEPSKILLPSMHLRLGLIKIL
jgi:hypothetical protein